MRAEDVAKRLRVQADRGILGVDDAFQLVGFAMAADTIEGLIEQNRRTMEAFDEVSNAMDQWRAKALAERERCATIVETCPDPRNHPACAERIATAIRSGSNE